MGALHEGHLALIRRARAECDTVVVSVFVNPTQFNDPEDLWNYPRDPERDRKILEDEEVDLLFMPDREEVYPEADPQVPDVDISYFEGIMEGPHRPGHFEGVVMVLDRFFAMIRPHRAYFGEKDFQQLLVVRSLVEQRGWEIEVVGVPTVRESGGLALSSRNEKLSKGGRRKALAIPRVLERMRSRFGEVPVKELEREAQDELQSQGFEVDYVMLAREKDLRPVEEDRPKEPVRAFVAASIEEVRLIDNTRLNP